MDRVLTDPIDPPICWGDYIYRLKVRRAANALTTHVGAEHPRLAWLLHRLVRGLRARRVLELGVQSGGSGYGIMTALADTTGWYVGIDNEADRHAQYGRCGLADLNHAVFITGDAGHVLPHLKFGVWDLIHVDHYKEYYVRDVQCLLATGQIGRNTVVVFHDIEGLAAPCWPACREHFGEVRAIPGSVIENGVGICWRQHDATTHDH
jgi:predicted O-methyltransferase YrrM